MVAEEIAHHPGEHLTLMISDSETWLHRLPRHKRLAQGRNLVGTELVSRHCDADAGTLIALYVDFAGHGSGSFAH